MSKVFKQWRESNASRQFSAAELPRMQTKSGSKVTAHITEKPSQNHIEQNLLASRNYTTTMHFCQNT